MVTPIATPVYNPDMIVTSSLQKSIQTETTTKISDLPVNLVEEILSKVPLKYMRAVRLTCKHWDALSKSGCFSNMHIDKLSAVREGESLIVAMMDYNLFLMRVVLVDNEDPIIECQGKLNKQNKISKVFHCDGLLICVLKDNATKVVVCNPYWGQTWSIECRYSHRLYGRDRLSYAFGYEDKGSCRSYKLLRFLDKYYDEPVSQFSWYEIYDFDSSTWKTLDITPNSRIICDEGGVSLKGNTYWPALQSYPENYVIKYDHIICFDFTSESFGPPLRLPEAAYDKFVALSCVREEKLVVLLHHEDTPKEFEIWITTKIDQTEKVLWSKFLKVVRTELSPLLSCDNFFIDEEKKVAMGFSEDYYQAFKIVGEAGYLKMLKVVERGRDRSCRVMACSYVPSLVKIKQPASGGQKKQQNDLEKKRYDQNMLSLAAIVKRRSV